MIIARQAPSEIKGFTLDEVGMEFSSLLDQFSTSAKGERQILGRRETRDSREQKRNERLFKLTVPAALLRYVSRPEPREKTRVIQSYALPKESSLMFFKLGLMPFI